jgi:hypothetical protein
VVHRVVSGKDRFRDGFVEFLGDRETADAVVVLGPGGEELAVHRLLLMHASRFFRRAFAVQMRERASAVVRWDFADPQRVLPTVVAWVYGADITVDTENVVAIAAAAHQLEIPELERVCSDFIAEALSPRLALALLRQTVTYPECEPLGITDRLVAYVTENYPGFARCGVRLDIGSLPLSTAVKVLSSDLFNADEDVIFDLARDYVAQHGDMDAEGRAAVWRCIRLPLVSPHKLRGAHKIEGFPQEYLIESLLVALETAKSGTKSPTPSRKDPSAAAGASSLSLSSLKAIEPRLPNRILEVRRFNGSVAMTHGGWAIEGNNRDVICFAVDKNVSLVGVGALEGDLQQTVEVSIDLSLFDDGKSLLRHTARYGCHGSKQPVQLMF